MTTAITWKTKNGNHARCDAKCHKAKGTKCKCLCYGLLHGSLVNRSIDKHLDLIQRSTGWIAANLREDLINGKIQSFAFPPEIFRLPLGVKKGEPQSKQNQESP